MKRIILSAVFAATFLAGCSSDDDKNNDGTDINAKMNGEWSLVKLGGGFGGDEEVFAEDLITWTFDAANNEVTLEDNRIIVDGQPGAYTLEDGTYDYTLDGIEGVCNAAMTMEEYEVGCVTADGNEMKISMGHVDGVTYTFKR